MNIRQKIEKALSLPSIKTEFAGRIREAIQDLQISRISHYTRVEPTMHPLLVLRGGGVEVPLQSIPSLGNEVLVLYSDGNPPDVSACLDDLEREMFILCASPDISFQRMDGESQGPGHHNILISSAIKNLLDDNTRLELLEALRLKILDIIISRYPEFARKPEVRERLCQEKKRILQNTLREHFKELLRLDEWHDFWCQEGGVLQSLHDEVITERILGR